MALPDGRSLNKSISTREKSGGRTGSSAVGKMNIDEEKGMRLFRMTDREKSFALPHKIKYLIG